jgi:hypothetical protein
MKPGSSVRVVAGVTLVACLALSVLTLRKIDQIREGATLKEVLYIPSAKTVKRMSLGYDGLLADIYWTRAVQYFGSHHHAESKEYLLLKPLLEITTTLDPHLLPAYEFGSIFLAQKPPEGAGDPKAAAELVKRGIRENPDAWKLWYHLGFIEWQELKDPAAASEAFLSGSKVPGSHPWMKVMAAALAQHAGEIDTARYLWTNIYQNSEDKLIRKNAIKRLTALKSDEQVEFLQKFIDDYRAQMGRYPSSFSELISAGWIRRIPLDPLGYPYEIRNGRVVVANPKELPFITKGLPEGQEASDLPKMPSN